MNHYSILILLGVLNSFIKLCKLISNWTCRPFSDNYYPTTEEHHAVNVVDQPGVSCTTSVLCLNSCMEYAHFLSVPSSFYAHLHM